MSVFNSIIKESSVSENILESTINMLNSIETLEEGVMNYTPSMIPVHARNTTEGTKYIVEFDMLQKLAGYENSSIAEAFESVCLENGIDADDTYVYVSESTCEIVSESYMNDYTSGALMNISNDINSLSESNINMLSYSLNEAVKFNFLAFDKMAQEHQELKEIKEDLKRLNSYRQAGGNMIYKERGGKTALKVLRAIAAFCSNVDRTVTPAYNIVIGVTRGSSFIKIFSFIISNIIVSTLEKLIVYAIDKGEEKEIKSDIKLAIIELEKIEMSTKDDNFKEKIHKEIENLNNKLRDLEG